ncbi:asparagine synthetase B [bacterium]|nr:MAG: asparagine synthetase B [bacterium]
MRILLAMFLILALAAPAGADLLVPMDGGQQNHLKAYGLAYKVLKRGQTLSWLLNYRGGSFLIPTNSYAEVEARLMGVTVERVTATDVAAIRRQIADANMDEVLLEVPPRIAIYAPPNFQPWDDAVSLALEYAEVDFETIFDAEVLAGGLSAYDWVHLHHEDFTGQYGKFYFNFGRTAWYQEQQKLFEQLAASLGYPSVRALKGAVALSIKEYVVGGGFLFAMCSATDTFDIALAGLGVDFAPAVFDGTPVVPGCCDGMLDYGNCVAFEDFRIETDPSVYEYSDIDTSNYASLRGAEADYFTLFEFSARHDPVPTMLTQSHRAVVNGFLGQTTGFQRRLLKDHVIVLAEVEGTEEVKYLHGAVGRGTFTFYGGHDPEDYTHQVGDPPTDLDLHPHSPGYRLILNNILFPAARKKPQKT